MCGGHVIIAAERISWPRCAPPAAKLVRAPSAAMSGPAALAASRGLRSLTSRFARGGSAPLRAVLAAPPAQPRAFRTALVVEMGRRAAKIANRKARRPTEQPLLLLLSRMRSRCVNRARRTRRARSCTVALASRSSPRACPAARTQRGRSTRAAVRALRADALSAVAQRQGGRRQREQQRHAGGGAANRAPEQHPKGARHRDAKATPR